MAVIRSSATPFGGRMTRPGQLAVGVTGLVTVFLALHISLFAARPEVVFFQHELERLLAFASLTIWLTLTIGIERRGVAAIIVLAFATAMDLFILPAREGLVGLLPAANFGIVLAYSGMQLYWFRIRDAGQAKRNESLAA